MSDEEKSVQRFDKLKTFLLKQNYPTKLKDHGSKRALETDRETLRKKVQFKKMKYIIICINISRKTEIVPVMKRNLPILYQDNKLKDLRKKTNLKVKDTRRIQNES